MLVMGRSKCDMNNVMFYRAAIAKDERIGLVSFTGSTAVGALL